MNESHFFLSDGFETKQLLVVSRGSIPDAAKQQSSVFVRVVQEGKYFCP